VHCVQLRHDCDRTPSVSRWRVSRHRGRRASIDDPATHIQVTRQLAHRKIPSCLAHRRHRPPRFTRRVVALHGRTGGIVASCPQPSCNACTACESLVVTVCKRLLLPLDSFKTWTEWGRDGGEGYERLSIAKKCCFSLMLVALPQISPSCRGFFS